MHTCKACCMSLPVHGAWVGSVETRVYALSRQAGRSFRASFLSSSCLHGPLSVEACTQVDRRVKTGAMCMYACPTCLWIGPVCLSEYPHRRESESEIAEDFSGASASRLSELTVGQEGESKTETPDDQKILLPSLPLSSTCLGVFLSRSLSVAFFLFLFAFFLSRRALSQLRQVLLEETVLSEPLPCLQSSISFFFFFSYARPVRERGEPQSGKRWYGRLSGGRRRLARVI